MPANAIETVSEAHTEQIGRFEPATKAEIHNFCTQLPELYRTAGKALHSAAENMTHVHIHKDVIESVHELANITAGLADHADEVLKSHLSRHAIWLDD